MQQEDGSAHCLICFEELPDVSPPCGTILEPLFHKQCLALAMRVSKTNRCPHCNIECPTQPTTRYNCLGDALLLTIESARRRVNNLLDHWLQNKEYWSVGPVFIPITDGLMDQTDAGIVNTSLCDAVCNQLNRLCSPQRKCSVFHSPCEQAVIHRHRDGASCIETEAILRRTALTAGDMRSITQDGFTLAVSRSRYSKRTVRPLCLLEKREVIISSP